MLRIVFTGTHSTGKTTLVDALRDAGVPELAGASFITGLTRGVPKEQRGTLQGQEAILRNYVQKFIVLDKYVCDRSLFDICAYSLVNKVWSFKRCIDVIRIYFQKNVCIIPTHLFYVPIEFAFVQDGGRPDNMREDVDAAILLLLKHSSMPYTELRGSVEERTEKILHKLKN